MGWLKMLYLKKKRNKRENLMNKALVGLIMMLVSGVSCADAVDSLQDASKQSKKIRDLTIDCYVEVKISKAKGWKTDECREYKIMSKTELKAFRNSVKRYTNDFREQSKNKDLSIRRIKRGLKKLMIIQSNMESVGAINKKIKKLAKS